MSIELSRSRIEPIIRKELGIQLAHWQAKDLPRNYVLTNLLVEIMWEVAATTQREGPEKGILAGVRMLKTWKD